MNENNFIGMNILATPEGSEARGRPSLRLVDGNKNDIHDYKKRD